MGRRNPPKPGSTVYVCSACHQIYKREQDLKSHWTQSTSAACQALALRKRPSKAKAKASSSKTHKHQPSRGRSSSLPAQEPSYTMMDIDPPVDELAEQPAPSPTDRRARVEEVIDEGDKHATVIDKYSIVAGAGMIKRTDASPHQHAYDTLRNGSTNVYSPFANRVEWELAQWVKNEGISDAAFDRFCDLPSMRNENGLQVENARQLNQKIDQLPGYGAWQHRTISIQAEGSTQLQSHEIFYRDPIDCLRALWADPAFQAELMVSPEMRWSSESRTIRMYLDMNTGDWWNAKQGNLPFGATVVPIIISTDKTELSMFSGEAAAYPIYMTIGNIPSYMRRQPSRRAQILIGYLPVSAIDKTELTELAARNARAQLFHAAVRAILEPLRTAAVTGVELTDSKGNVRDGFPLLAAYVADYPEPRGAPEANAEPDV